MPDDLFTTRKFEFSKIIDFLKLEIISVEYFLLLSCCFGVNQVWWNSNFIISCNSR